MLLWHQICLCWWTLTAWIVPKFPTWMTVSLQFSILEVIFSPPSSEYDGLQLDWIVLPLKYLFKWNTEKQIFGWPGNKSQTHLNTKSSKQTWLWFKGPQATKVGHHRTKSQPFLQETSVSRILIWLICLSWSKFKVNCILRNAWRFHVGFCCHIKSVQRLTRTPSAWFLFKVQRPRCFLCRRGESCNCLRQNNPPQGVQHKPRCFPVSTAEKITHPSPLKWLILHRHWEASTASELWSALLKCFQ